MTIRNKHKVSKRTWSSWSPVARRVFNATYSGRSMYPNPRTKPKINPLTLQCIAWNAAWIAASAVDDEEVAVE